MRHLTLPLILAIRDGETYLGKRAVQRHLEDCDFCQARLAEAVRLNLSLRRGAAPQGDAARANHPPPGMLAAYIDRRLSAAARRAVTHHVTNCPICAEEIAAIRRALPARGGPSPGG